MKRSLLSPNPVRQSKGLWDAVHDRKTGIKTEGSDYEQDGQKRESEGENVKITADSVFIYPFV